MQRKSVLAVLVALVFLISSFVVLFSSTVYQGTEAELKSAESRTYASRLIKVQFTDRSEQELLHKYDSVLNDHDKMLLVISRERTVDSFVNISHIAPKYIVPPRIITSKDVKSLAAQKCIKSAYLSDIILSSQYIKASKDVIVPFIPLPYNFLKGLNLSLYSGRLPKTSNEIVLTYRGVKALFGSNPAEGKFVYGTDPMRTAPFQNARFTKKYRVCGVLKPLPDEFFYVTFGESGGFSILPENYIPLPEKPSFNAVNNKSFFPEEELFVLPEKGQSKEALKAINAFLQKFNLQQEEIYPKILTTYRSLETIMSTDAIRNKLKFIILVGIFLLLLSIFDSAVFTNLLIKLRQREIAIKRAIGASILGSCSMSFY